MVSDSEGLSLGRAARRSAGHDARGDVLCDHERGQVRIRRRDVWHNGSVDRIQPVDAEDRTAASHLVDDWVSEPITDSNRPWT